jgi:hypothetical protein
MDNQRRGADNHATHRADNCWGKIGQSNRSVDRTIWLWSSSGRGQPLARLCFGKGNRRNGSNFKMHRGRAANVQIVETGHVMRRRRLVIGSYSTRFSHDKAIDSASSLRHRIGTLGQDCQRIPIVGIIDVTAVK